VAEMFDNFLYKITSGIIQLTSLPILGEAKLESSSTLEIVESFLKALA